MNTGTVKFYNTEKKFGFITDDKTGKEIFVHVSGLVDEIQTNDKVRFETTDGKKGLNAIEVRQA